MPVYDFKCPKCGQTAEHVCPIKEVPRTIPCSHCGNDMRRQFKPVGIHWKTTGQTVKKVR